MTRRTSVSTKLVRRLAMLLIVACFTSHILVSSPPCVSQPRSLKIEQQNNGPHEEFDLQTLEDPGWGKGLTTEQKISKLDSQCSQLTTENKPLIWFGLLQFKPQEITKTNLQMLSVLFSKCSTSPGDLSEIAEKQWQTILFLLFENPDNQVEPEERYQLIENLLKPTPGSINNDNSDATNALIELFHREKRLGHLDNPESLLLLETLLRRSAVCQDPALSDVFAEIQTDVLDHMTEKETALLQLIPDVPGGTDEFTRRNALSRLEKKLSLLDKYKSSKIHTQLAIAAEYFKLGELSRSESIIQSALQSAQQSMKPLPSFDQNARSEVAVLALCLSTVQVRQNEPDAATKTLNIAKQILPEISNQFAKGWEPAIPAIEAEIALKIGDTASAEALFQQADLQFDALRVHDQYEYFLKAHAACREILPNEQTVLEDLIALLRKENKSEIADEKSQTLQKIKIDAIEKEADQSLRAQIDSCEQAQRTPYYGNSRCTVQEIISALVNSPCKSSYKIDLVEHMAKTFIEHSRFSNAIELINGAIKEPSITNCDDFPIHKTALQQMKIRAEVTSGRFETAAADCATFLAKPPSTDNRLRNQWLDVRGWQARMELLSGRPDKARKDLEQVCKEWDKEGTNTFISDYREHLRDLTVAYFGEHEYASAARALRYYLKKISYNNGSEYYQAQSLLGRCYQKLGNVGLAEPLIDAVVSSLKERSDDIERVYAITYIADFYFDQNEKKLALKFFKRGERALEGLGLQNLPVATYIKTKSQLLGVRWRG